MRKLALVVLSGGQDSTTCLALAIKAFGAKYVRAITFDYGQRHAAEIAAAARVAALADIPPPELIVLGPQLLAGSSPLTDHSALLEQYESYEQMDKIIGDRVEKTFVPMRNALFLTIAANRAVVMGAHTILTGVCQADNANYPDCRKVFIMSQAMTINHALGLVPDDPVPGTDMISIDTPLMHLNKEQSIERLLSLGGPEMFAWLAWSHTAYDGQYPPLGHDHATVLRAEGFKRAGWPDPLILRAVMEGRMSLPTDANYQNITVNAALETIIREHGAVLTAKGLYHG